VATTEVRRPDIQRVTGNTESVVADLPIRNDADIPMLEMGGIVLYGTSPDPMNIRTVQKAGDLIGKVADTQRSHEDETPRGRLRNEVSMRA